MTTTIIKAHQVPSPRGGRRARAAWTPTPNADPAGRMRTALVRFDAIVTLLQRERAAHRMETILAQPTPHALLDAYAADLAPWCPVARSDTTSATTVVFTCRVVKRLIGGWPDPYTLAEVSLGTDGRIRARDVVGDRDAPGGRLCYRRWVLCPIYPIVLDVLLDGVGDEVTGLEEAGPERLAEAAPEAEALLHRIPQLASRPLAEMGPAGARVDQRVRLT